jgi:hypothetical protein
MAQSEKMKGEKRCAVMDFTRVENKMAKAFFFLNPLTLLEREREKERVVATCSILPYFPLTPFLFRHSSLSSFPFSSCSTHLFLFVSGISLFYPAGPTTHKDTPVSWVTFWRVFSMEPLSL